MTYQDQQQIWEALTSRTRLNILLASEEAKTRAQPLRPEPFERAWRRALPIMDATQQGERDAGYDHQQPEHTRREMLPVSVFPMEQQTSQHPLDRQRTHAASLLLAEAQATIPDVLATVRRNVAMSAVAIPLPHPTNPLHEHGRVSAGYQRSVDAVRPAEGLGGAWEAARRDGREAGIDNPRFRPSTLTAWFERQSEVPPKVLAAEIMREPGDYDELYDTKVEVDDQPVKFRERRVSKRRKSH